MEMEHTYIDAVVQKEMDCHVVKWYQGDQIIVNVIQKNKDIPEKQYKKK
jgi:hypothetical protein